MLYALLIILCFVLIGIALFFSLKTAELKAQVSQLESVWKEREGAYESELAKLEKIRHIPNVIEKARRTEEEIGAKIAQAEKRAQEVIAFAAIEAQDQARKIRAQAEGEVTITHEAAQRVKDEAYRLRREAQVALAEASKEAREIASKARKEAKEKREQADTVLNGATALALQIRLDAEARAREIDADAFAARGKARDYEDVIHALERTIKGYENVPIAPSPHALDELADEFGFSKPGEKLKLARERTRLMQQNGTAASCGYPDGWKRDHALKFVLGTFNGQADTILARVKSGNQARLTQEMKDSYALVNKDGEVYKNARIQREYLDARLGELKWAVVVQRIKEQAREEQRAIREQIREEQKAKREIERAIKQAAREEELVNKAIARIREQFEQASESEKAKYQAQLTDLNAKLLEAEEKGRKALSMAQQTKRGHVYVISNIGSFGEDVYKIGLTRRLDPLERVHELGDASVPFPFDVHAMLSSEDAPALETDLHRRFVERQVNKVNKRKEFFKLPLRDIRQAVEELQIDATWTLQAEAAQYRESLALDQAMKTDSTLKEKWLEEQATFDFGDEATEREEDLALTSMNP
ncbi:GIY-YIG nuclease family protein [Aquisphaera insulae]|uniref:GIY-YIG nuclease family protein n=1 Tax=Aquisphaera insulae TaxID=2712864 RepID=UPI0013EE2486|nr:GIY-YIG nuclease family protein [Aquisphaera insulae]